MVGTNPMLLPCFRCSLENARTSLASWKTSGWPPVAGDAVDMAPTTPSEMGLVMCCNVLASHGVDLTGGRRRMRSRVCSVRLVPAEIPWGGGDYVGV